MKIKVNYALRMVYDDSSRGGTNGVEVTMTCRFGGKRFQVSNEAVFSCDSHDRSMVLVCPLDSIVPPINPDGSDGVGGTHAIEYLVGPTKGGSNGRSMRSLV